jgi:hypothetical protein
MPDPICLHEAAAIEAQRSGEWEDALAAHFESCPHCREAVRIASWMETLAATTAAHRTLPDPDLLWIKSRLFERQAAADRVLQPLLVGDTVARSVVGAFAAAWLALSWPSMQSYVIAWLNGIGGGESIVQSAANPWSVTLVSVLAAAAMLLVVRVVHPMLTRE